jgi:hypothetical protein
MQIFYACDLNEKKSFRATHFEKTFPGIKWHGGHSGEKLSEQDSEKLMTILESYVRQMTEYRFGAARTDLSRFPAQWQRFSEKAGKESFLRLSEALSDARKQLQFNTNYQAVLEKIIFAFMGEGNLWLSSSESVSR